MNILNLFGKKPQTSENKNINELPEELIMEQEPVNSPPLDLFIDNEPPQLEEKLVERQSKINSFLNRNYHAIGLNDGYEYHTNETLETGKKKIRAEFQLIIDQSIQEKYTNRLQLKNLIVDVSKVSEETKQKLENTIEELNSSLELLHKQKDLSIENEGWVMNTIHSYQQGFIQGLNDFLERENLLNSIKNF
jgi:hypothetical protein